uniref:Uncharacterized protein n=1 Tax=Salix viminalis TaxID=40686 RepID=A0A6N2MMX2_SALVM
MDWSGTALLDLVGARSCNVYGIFKCRNQRWCSLFHASKHFMRPNCQDLPLRCTTVARDHFSHFGANGRNTSEDKHGPVKDGASFDNEKTQREQVNENAKHCDAHPQLGEQDQKEWLHNEKLAIEKLSFIGKEQLKHLHRITSSPAGFCEDESESDIVQICRGDCSESERVSGECDSSSESMKNESAGTSETSKRPLQKQLFPASLHCAFLFAIL